MRAERSKIIIVSVISPSAAYPCDFGVFDASSVCHGDSRLPREAGLQLRLFQQPKQATNVFPVRASMCCMWAEGVCVWDAQLECWKRNWVTVWIRAGSEEHVDCDISNSRGPSLRERVCLQRWSFLPARCGLIHLTVFVPYLWSQRVWFCLARMEAGEARDGVAVLVWAHSLSWFRSVWTPGVPGAVQTHFQYRFNRAETQRCDASALQCEAEISTERGANGPGKGGRGCITKPDKRTEKTKENEGNGRSETWAVWSLGLLKYTFYLHG